MSALIRTKAIVLHRTNYGEADRILHFLTPEYGKLGVIARGVRREKSKLAGGIELFAICDVTVSQGKSELGIVTAARLIRFYGHIMHDYDRLQFGYEAIKRINKSADAVDDSSFFILLEQTFGALDDETIMLAVTKTWFYLQLAIIVGVGINLSTDMNGMKLVEDEQYEFDEYESTFRFHGGGRFTSDHIKLLRLLSAQQPRVAMHVQGIGGLVNDCLWIAERVAV
ncbi:MAG: DNA repair protein RecO [Candidatus Saccharimonadales bacterium]